MESLYGDAEGGDVEQPAPDKAPEDKTEGHTELVGKKLLGIGDDTEVKPGQRYTVEVVAMHGDQVECRSAKAEESKPMSEDDQLSAMTE